MSRQAIDAPTEFGFILEKGRTTNNIFDVLVYLDAIQATFIGQCHKVKVHGHRRQTVASGRYDLE